MPVIHDIFHQWVKIDDIMQKPAGRAGKIKGFRGILPHQSIKIKPKTDNQRH